MQEVRYGDIFEHCLPTSNILNVVVHGTNCQGVMGSGIARQIRDMYPGAYDAYKQMEQQEGKLRLGDVSIYNEGALIIVNANTQEFYRNYRHPDGTVEPSNKVFVDYDAVQSAFEKVAYFASQVQCVVHYPKIGAGLANGDWEIIQQKIDNALGDIPRVLWIKE